jgi:hypothetical protein
MIHSFSRKTGCPPHRHRRGGATSPFQTFLNTIFEFKQASRSVLLIMFTNFCFYCQEHILQAHQNILSPTLLKAAYRIDVMCSDRPIEYNGLAQPGNRACLWLATNIYISSGRNFSNSVIGRILWAQY